MTEYEKGLSLQDIREAERTAMALSRALNKEVGISQDLSITIGNVTFGRSLGLTAMGMADMYDYFSEGDQHMRLDGGGPDMSGYRGQSSEPSVRPEVFVKTLEPATGIRKLARKILFG